MQKIILISGGSDGLGKSIAKQLSPNHQVIILSHNQQKLEAVAEELKCDFVYADVTEYSSVKLAVDKVISKYKKIDILINNAGIWMEGALESYDPKKITELIGVNTLGTIFLTKSVLPSMKENTEGRIINIISEDGLIAKKDKSVYSASKWAITGFTRCLQEDLHGSKILVTGIYPGVLNTSLFEKQGVSRDLTKALDPSEVARLIEYVINLSQDTLLPEIRIKNKNNPNMDDTSSSNISLDINPDLITPQTSTPQAANQQTQSVNIPPVSPGVIDITPGTSEESHPSKVEDITPDGTPPAETQTPADPETAVQNPALSTPPTDNQPQPTSSVDVAPEAKDVIDITPGVPTPAVSEEKTEEPVSQIPSGTHLADFAPAETVATTETVQSAPVTETPPVTDSETPTTPISPVTENQPASAAPVSPDVELPPAVQNPLQEDPDLVKLNK